MNRLPLLSAKTETDLQKLVEPLASYISATNCPRAALLLALLLVINNNQEIDESAKKHIATFSEDHVG